MIRIQTEDRPVSVFGQYRKTRKHKLQPFPVIFILQHLLITENDHKGMSGKHDLPF